MTDENTKRDLSTRHERQRLIRAKIKQSQATNQMVVRKVWLLPSEMCDRLVDYQEASLIRTEVEAARRLLDIALQARGL